MASIVKLAVIRHTSKGYIVESESGKKLGGPYEARDAAEKRLKDVEMFKHMDEKKSSQEVLDSLRVLARTLRENDEPELASKVSYAISIVAGTNRPKTEYSYSSIMRELRKDNPDDLKTFMYVYKVAFDNAVKNDLDEPERVALLEAMKAIEYEDKYA